VCHAAADSLVELRDLGVLRILASLSQDRNFTSVQRRYLTWVLRAGALRDRAAMVQVASLGYRQYFARVTPDGVRVVDPFGRTPAVSTQDVRAVAEQIAAQLGVALAKEAPLERGSPRTATRAIRVVSNGQSPVTNNERAAGRDSRQGAEPARSRPVRSWNKNRRG
jgi:hypothetical protein